MRSIKHWNPRYVIDRLADVYYQRSNSDAPWLTKEANSILATYLDHTDQCVEFGSGRSSLWLAQRVGKLTTVEHDGHWFRQVSAMAVGISGLDLRHVDVSAAMSAADATAYVSVFDEITPGSLDMVLVDGLFRALCAKRAVDGLKPGGVLVLDNANRYLPSPTRTPLSRACADGPVDSEWSELWADLATWRRIWTSSGVSDTAFFFKPT